MHLRTLGPFPRQRRVAPVPLGPRRAGIDGLAAATGGRVTPLPRPQAHPEASQATAQEEGVSARAERTLAEQRREVPF